MAFRCRQADIEGLVALAEHRILTAEQFTRLRRMSGMQVARRRLAQMEREGLATSRPRQLRRRRGRPEKLIWIAEAGIALLRERRRVAEWIPDEQLAPLASHGQEHQLLLNWFRIHLCHAVTRISGLDTLFFSSTSPFLPLRSDGSSIVREKFTVQAMRRRRSIRFIPDAVFCIRNKEKQRGLLFFLEVDMGTEPLISPGRRTRDIRHKVSNYQTYFAAGKYKRYEHRFGVALRGFRVLALTSAVGRRQAVERLLEELAGAEFIWTADAATMRSQGLAAAIWTRGGSQEGRLHSILGRHFCQVSPLRPLGR